MKNRLLGLAKKYLRIKTQQDITGTSAAIFNLSMEPLSWLCSASCPSHSCVVLSTFECLKFCSLASKGFNRVILNTDLFISLTSFRIPRALPSNQPSHEPVTNLVRSHFRGPALLHQRGGVRALPLRLGHLRAVAQLQLPPLLPPHHRLQNPDRYWRPILVTLNLWKIFIEDLNWMFL